MLEILRQIYSLLFSIYLPLYLVALTLVLVPTSLIYLRFKVRRLKAKNGSGKLVVGIFHPFSTAGGGGEKVMWLAVHALQRQYPEMDINIYTANVESPATEILSKASGTFNIQLGGSNINFVYLQRRKWLESDRYPYFTLLGQALGSMYVGLEAITKLCPDVYLETTGFTFTLPLFKYLGGCRTGSYVHYPIITKNMIRRVASRHSLYNNRGFIARSFLFTYAKLIYYKFFAWLYYLAGQCSDITLVNSTFTMEHLPELWECPVHLVYPPCDTRDLTRMERPITKPKQIRILSVAQFRPEKAHAVQLQALYELREILPEHIFDNVTLVMCGGCRNADDKARVKDLKDFSRHLSLENHVEFKVNVSYPDLLDEFKKAFIGIHTMVDEHFGIGVVEMMAAGLITVAHKSGGPLLDIIETSNGSRLGFLSGDALDYAEVLKFIILCPVEHLNEIREKARASVDRFSNDKFKGEFLRAVAPLFK